MEPLKCVMRYVDVLWANLCVCVVDFCCCLVYEKNTAGAWRGVCVCPVHWFYVMVSFVVVVVVVVSLCVFVGLLNLSDVWFF